MQAGETVGIGGMAGVAGVAGAVVAGDVLAGEVLVAGAGTVALAEGLAAGTFPVAPAWA